MFRQKRRPSDFGREIEAHLQFETERLREEGLTEAEARAAARRAFGNVTEAEERFYESWSLAAWFSRCRARIDGDVDSAQRALRVDPAILLREE